MFFKVITKWVRESSIVRFYQAKCRFHRIIGCRILVAIYRQQQHYQGGL